MHVTDAADCNVAADAQLTDCHQLSLQKVSQFEISGCIDWTKDT